MNKILGDTNACCDMLFKFEQKSDQLLAILNNSVIYKVLCLKNRLDLLVNYASYLYSNYNEPTLDLLTKSLDFNKSSSNDVILKIAIHNMDPIKLKSNKNKNVVITINL